MECLSQSHFLVQAMPAAVRDYCPTLNASNDSIPPTMLVTHCSAWLEQCKKLFLSLLTFYYDVINPSTMTSLTPLL